MKAFYVEARSRYANRDEWRKRTRARMALYHVSQGDLAKQSGIARSEVCRCINGDTRPTIDRMLVIDEALDELIEGE